jgi:hypothetical protein
MYYLFLHGVPACASLELFSSYLPPLFFYTLELPCAAKQITVVIFSLTSFLFYRIVYQISSLYAYTNATVPVFYKRALYMPGCFLAAAIDSCLFLPYLVVSYAPWPVYACCVLLCLGTLPTRVCCPLVSCCSFFTYAFLALLLPSASDGLGCVCGWVYTLQI